ALQNLMLWVPHLGLSNCARQRGRFPSYIAVAHWRPSSTGRPLEQRGQNLKICGSGIKDFGDGRTYSPIDLVMAAKGGELKEAFDWLDEKTGWSAGGPEIDVEAMRAKQEERTKQKEDVEAPEGGCAPREKQKERKYRFKLTPFWEMRPGVSEIPYLIDELIP